MRPFACARALPIVAGMDTSTARAARRRSRGLSLVELVVVLAICATLGSLTVSAWGGVASSMRLNGYASSFVTQLQLARGEAIKRNARVALCKSPNGETCVASGGWEQGWIVFHDANNNGVRDPLETIVSVTAALAEGYRLTGNTNVARYVSYSAHGGTELVSGAFQAGTLTLCQQSAGSVEGREIVIGSVGSPRVRKATLASCN